MLHNLVDDLLTHPVLKLCTVNRRDLPSAVDLDALNSKPFKDATQADSIRKLEQRLEGVAAKGDLSFS